jgi:hypothetical protein
MTEGRRTTFSGATPPVLCCPIDHRSSTSATQADRTGATLLGKADRQEPRGTFHMKGDAAGLAGSLSGRNSSNCRSRSGNAKDWRSRARGAGAPVLRHFSGSLLVRQAPTFGARYATSYSGAPVPCRKSVLISSMTSEERVKRQPSVCGIQSGPQRTPTRA